MFNEHNFYYVLSSLRDKKLKIDFTNLEIEKFGFVPIYCSGLPEIASS